jgi:hypothetical protein
MLYEIGQLDTKVAYVTLQDARMARYSPPEELVNKPRTDGYGRFHLNMCGLKMYESPWAFEFTNKMDESDILISTYGS